MEIKNPYQASAALNLLNKGLADLIDRGYKHKFRREADCIFCIELYVWISPDQFTVDASYFFDEFSYPDSARILYAITTSSGIKGTLVDQYGVYADNMSRELNLKLEKTGTQLRIPGNEERRNTEELITQMKSINNRGIKQFNNQTIET